MPRPSLARAGEPPGQPEAGRSAGGRDVLLTGCTVVLAGCTVVLD